jgi:hypothetical protein
VACIPITSKFKFTTFCGLTPVEASELVDLAVRRISGSDMMGPGLLHGSCGAHGQLYAAFMSRDEFDAISSDNFRWIWDIDKHTFHIPSSVEIVPINDDTYLMTDLTHGFYTTIDRFTRDACEQFMHKSKKIPNVATDVINKFGSNDRDAIELLADIQSSLIHLVRIGILVPVAPKCRLPQTKYSNAYVM